ncbi:sialidase family protein [Rhizosphaericola mali]|uniref:sialidase family protein n=1 Tax=Rhizosphaericola mali TaxID=2545455 RepID=UPI001CD9AE15|nr:sialidase family protein [Rhizosphaericola mali]
MKKLLFLLFILSVSTSYIFAQKQYQIIDSGTIINEPNFKMYHAVTIVQIDKDSLLYAWFAGDHEGAKNVCIWGSYRNLKNKNQFSAPFKLAEGVTSKGDSMACWNPVLFKSTTGQLFLDYKVGPNPREWWAERKISLDNGHTWTNPDKLSDSLLGPIRNKPIQLQNGTILYPSSTESNDEKKWISHIENSDKYGKNWKYLPINCDTFGVIQPSILKYKKGKLQLLMRSRQNVIVSTWSTDNGNNWSKLQSINLPNPNSGIDAVTLHNDLQMLVYNPMLAGKDWWMGRAKLKVAISKNGIDWQDILTLENHDKGEYSYPAIIEDSNHIIHIAYTDDRKNLKFVDVKM